jgi:hypothetical protein
MLLPHNKVPAWGAAYSLADEFMGTGPGGTAGITADHPVSLFIQNMDDTTAPAQGTLAYAQKVARCAGWVSRVGVLHRSDRRRAGVATARPPAARCRSPPQRTNAPKGPAARNAVCQVPHCPGQGTNQLPHHCRTAALARRLPVLQVLDLRLAAGAKGQALHSSVHLSNKGGHAFGLCQGQPEWLEICDWPKAAQVLPSYSTTAPATLGTWLRPSCSCILLQIPRVGYTTLLDTRLTPGGAALPAGPWAGEGGPVGVAADGLRDAAAELREVRREP